MTYQIRRDSQMYGPYSREDIERYVGTGNILLTDQARPDETADWISVAELLGRSTAPPPPPADDLNNFQRMLYGGPVEARSAEFLWFPVVPWKFVVMSICTFGLYHIFWAYQNWNREAGRTREGMMVWARALFLNIWNFPLFRDIKDSAQENGVKAGWNYIALGIALLLFALCSRLPSPYVFVSLLSFLPYLPVVITIEKLNKQQASQVEERLNDRLSVVNIVLVVIMGLFWSLVILGLIVGHRTVTQP